MNYTTWIAENIPSLANASSDEVDALIRKAVRFASALLLGLRAVVFLVLMHLCTRAGASLGIQLLDGSLGWMVLMFFYLALYFLSEPLKPFLVRKRLKTLSGAAPANRNG